MVTVFGLRQGPRSRYFAPFAAAIWVPHNPCWQTCDENTDPRVSWFHLLERAILCEDTISRDIQSTMSVGSCLKYLKPLPPHTHLGLWIKVSDSWCLIVFAAVCILSYLSLSLIFAFVCWEFWLWSHLWSHGCAKTSTTNLAIRCAQITGGAQIEKCSWHRWWLIVVSWLCGFAKKYHVWQLQI